MQPQGVLTHHQDGVISAAGVAQRSNGDKEEKEAHAARLEVRMSDVPTTRTATHSIKQVRTLPMQKHVQGCGTCCSIARKEQSCAAKRPNARIERLTREGMMPTRTIIWDGDGDVRSDDTHATAASHNHNHPELVCLSQKVTHSQFPAIHFSTRVIIYHAAERAHSHSALLPARRRRSNLQKKVYASRVTMVFLEESRLSPAHERRAVLNHAALRRLTYTFRPAELCRCPHI